MTIKAFIYLAKMVVILLGNVLLVRNNKNSFFVCYLEVFGSSKDAKNCHHPFFCSFCPH